MGSRWAPVGSPHGGLESVLRHHVVLKESVDGLQFDPMGAMSGPKVLMSTVLFWLLE